MAKTTNVETNIYTSNGNKFVAPFPMDEVKRIIAENDGKITLKRYSVVQRIITDKNGETTEVLANTTFTTELNLNVSPVAAFEEVLMEDIEKVPEASE